MNDQQHAFWLAYIRHLADLLGLRDWEFELDRERPDNLSVGAQFSSFYGQKKARIWLNTMTMLSRPPEEIREVLVHELMHAHFEDLDEHVRLYVESVGGSAHFDSVYNREREITLQTVVMVVAPTLPLPAKYVPSDDEIFGVNPFQRPIDADAPFAGVTLNGAL